jgi:mannose-6-phosphate isomerase
VLTPFRVTPHADERVWGGTRLGPPRKLPIGERWLVGPSLVVGNGPYAGRTLDDVAGELGVALVGSAAPVRPGPRFPLIVKLLDPAAWLSVQVHPNDATARRLVGPDAVGKTEAWYVLDADPGAELLVGARPGVRQADLEAAMRSGAATTALLARHAVAAGDVLLVSAGTLHAVGPGVLLYELQQPSDITYRVDDWGRPASRTRPLHTRQAIASVIPQSRPMPRGTASGGRVLGCRHFTLDVFDAPTQLDPAGRTVQIVTAVDSAAELAGAGWATRLEALETIVVPAAADPWELRPGAGGRTLVAALP